LLDRPERFQHDCNALGGTHECSLLLVSDFDIALPVVGNATAGGFFTLRAGCGR